MYTFGLCLEIALGNSQVAYPTISSGTRLLKVQSRTCAASLEFDWSRPLVDPRQLRAHRHIGGSPRHCSSTAGWHISSHGSGVKGTHNYFLNELVRRCPDAVLVNTETAINLMKPTAESTRATEVVVSRGLPQPKVRK